MGKGRTSGDAWDPSHPQSEINIFQKTQCTNLKIYRPEDLSILRMSDKCLGLGNFHCVLRLMIW